MDADVRNAPATGFLLDLKAHRVVWGWRDGQALANVLDDASAARFLLVTSSARSRDRFTRLVTPALTTRCAGAFTGALEHVPLPSVDAGVDAAQRLAADSLVAFGGGTALDTAKAIGQRLGLPVFAVPTNFSGSEVTWNFGLTVDGTKQTVRDPAVLPRAVIYDSTLIQSLPLAQAICSGINAVAHAIEALYAPEANPFTQAIANAGIARMIQGLRSWASFADKHDAAEQCLAGAWLCGEALSQVGMGLHHRICHVLGGTYNLPHASVHTTLLPYVIGFNRHHVPALKQLDERFDGLSFAPALASFASAHGAPASLQAIGLRRQDIPDVARRVLAAPVANPRPVAVTDVEALLLRAYRGDLLERA
ncbi:MULTISPECIES: iron-containing alcohol dehydrogenase [Pandoraea]|uniref:Maleylacetate reductase n=1 Tax=Pandoraea capi TaxID=2508286 RepID=A0ABY6VU26_9BURK|nr:MULTISPECIES: iron-containing alcohol dehydrogenase [Pandoraea]MCI3208302.1 maleylacetate reductase [Pandoraea sp. LA3]MDN4586331.1 maleylacetate reductase [Pandoraea capi]VVD84168.1 maleylacetate reductase [Pandoraea capi]